jgi:hypothetical protein
MVVKQAIAWQRIIPFYGFFGHQDKQFDSPGGALFLHWIFTTIALLSFSPKLDSRNFVSGIYLYGYQLIMGQSHLCFAPDIDLVRAD